MSLKDVMGKVVGEVSADPTSARQAMLDKLQHARAAFEQGQPDQPGGRWISRDQAGRIAFAPTRPDGQQLVIGGQAVTFWNEEELPATLDRFAGVIAAGELDPQLTGPTPAGHSLPLERLAPAGGAR